MNRIGLRLITIAAIALTAALTVRSTSGASSLIRSHPAHAGTALQAVKITLRPYDPRTHGKYNFSNCTTVSPRLYPNLTCPETPRLLHYLSVRRLPRFDFGLPFLRSQSAPTSVRVVAVRYVNFRAANVDVLWDFGPCCFNGPHARPRYHTYATDTFVVLRQAAGWLIDDEYCAGRPATSVYNGIAGQSPCYRR